MADSSDWNAAQIVLLIGVMITPVISLITTVVIQIFQWRVGMEERRRDKEDRVEQRRQELEDRLISVKLAESTHAEIISVGEKATAAYVEANNANLKIQAVQNALNKSLNIPIEPVPVTVTTGAAPEETKK